MSTELEFSEPGSSPPPSKKPKPILSAVEQVRGESRQIVEKHEDQEERTASRLVRVEAGGVSRKTGKPLKVYFEVTAKAPGSPEITRAFSRERDAKVAYLAGTHGVTDLGTPLNELPPKLWRAYRDLKPSPFAPIQGALPQPLWLMGIRPTCWPTPKGLQIIHSHAEHMAIVGLDEDGTRMNSGSAGPGFPSEGVKAISLPAGCREALSALPWWAGSDHPCVAPPLPRPAGPVYRDVPEVELRAEEEAVLAAVPTKPISIPRERYPLQGPLPGPYGQLADVYRPAGKAVSA